MEKTAIEKIDGLSHEQLLKLIKNFCIEDPTLAKKIENILNQNEEQFKAERSKKNDLTRYESLWDEIECSTNEIDEYGGGPENEYDNVSYKLDEISKLFEKGALEQVRREFIANCLEYAKNEYGYGLEDSFMDTAFSVCKTRDDWLFVAETLKQNLEYHSHYTNLLMEIYRDHLKDDDEYLKLRITDLKTGNDYFDLVKYYISKGERQKAIETAKEGIAKTDWRTDDLYDFLIKEFPDDFSLILENFRHNPSFERYLEVEKHCNKNGWMKLSGELYQLVKKHNGELAVKIDFHHERYKAILPKAREETLQRYRSYDDWGSKLEKHLPLEILKIYKEAVDSHLNHKKVEYYSHAATYCGRIKRILKSLGKEDEWKMYISGIRLKYPKLPALQRELKNL